jgi:hypothetical protein
MRVRLDDLDVRFRELVLRRLGTYYAAPLDKDFLSSLPRKIWIVPVPRQWGIGDYDWEDHEDAKGLYKRYEARVGLGVASQIVGLGLLVGGCILAGLGVLPPMGQAFAGASLPLIAMPWLFQWRWRWRLRRQVTLEELRQAVAEVRLSDVEHRYIAVLDEAMRVDEPERQEEIRRILQSCAEVVERHRELEGMLGALPEPPDAAATRRTEAEIDKLREEIESETDPLVLSAQHERLQSLESTAESLRQVGTLSRRVGAQMQAIEAMLSGARAGLARMRLSHGTADDRETSELIDQLSRISVESSSLEKAIVEVHELRQSL